MSTLTTATAAPAAAAWQIDGAHSGIEFSVRHLMISTVRGRLGAIQGTVSSLTDMSGNPLLDVTIDAAGINTGNEQRDAHLRSADFFDVENHPTMRFRGTKVEGDPAGAFRLSGEMTIRGTTQPVTIEVETNGTTVDPWGNRRVGFSGRGSLSRSAFGLTWNQMLEAGGVTVGDEVKFTIDVALIQPAE